MRSKSYNVETTGNLSTALEKRIMGRARGRNVLVAKARRKGSEIREMRLRGPSFCLVEWPRYSLDDTFHCPFPFDTRTGQYYRKILTQFLGRYRNTYGKAGRQLIIVVLILSLTVSLSDRQLHS
jgi:hypothetical protein